MSKIELNTTISDFGWSQINANFQRIEDEFNTKVFYRNNPVGEPNSIESLEGTDQNNTDIYNVFNLRTTKFFIQGVDVTASILGGAAANNLVFGSPPPIGNVVPNTGAFTSLTSNAIPVVTTTASQTLTNKTIVLPTIGQIVNTGTLTLPTSTDNLVGRNTVDTLTNKTLTAPIISTIVNTGTLTLPTATDTLVGRTTTDTLTNKTLTSPTVNTPVIVGGTINNTTIGATTPNTGAFTTLSATSTVSGAGFTSLFASPPSIGNTTPASGAFTTLSSTGTFTPSQTSGIVGTTTNNNANAGSVGEYVTNTTTATSAGSGVQINATSISLTAGDWDVSGIVQFNPTGGAVPTTLQSGISTTSVTLGAFGTKNILQMSFTASSTQDLPTPIVRLSLSATTTVYLVTQINFTGGTSTVDGFIRARRIR